MKLSKVWKKTEKGTGGVRFCKKCGDELTSTSKYELCDGCRREEGSTIRKTVMGTLGLGGLFVVAWGVLKKAPGVLAKAPGVLAKALDVLTKL
jgi:hypothetical protein